MVSRQSPWLDEGQGTGSGYDTAYIDLNNDNRIDVTNERFECKIGTGSKDHPIRIKLSVKIGEQLLPYYTNFSAFQYDNAIHVNLRNSSYYTADVSFEGKRTEIAVLDLDSNGEFDDFERGRVFQGDRLLVDLNGDGKFSTRDDDRNESFPYSRFTLLNGNWYSVKSNKAGTEFTFERANPTMGSLRVPLHVHSAKLKSTGQTLTVKFSDGYCQTIAGTYNLLDLTVEPPGLTGTQRWTLRMIVNKQKPLKVEIKPAGSRLGFAERFQLRNVVTFQKGKSQANVAHVITDKKGNRYYASSSGYQTTKGFTVINEQGRLLKFKEIVGQKPNAWDIPSHYDGVYRLRPTIDLPGIKYESIDSVVRIEGGKILEVIRPRKKREPKRS